MDPVVAAVVDMLRTNAAELRAVAQGLNADTLNRPPASETSSIAVLVAHAATATVALGTAALTGSFDVVRYRAEERSPAFALRSAGMDDLTPYLDGLDRFIDHLAQQGAALTGRWGEPVQANGAPGDRPTSRAWRLIHAVEHLREHVAHAQLTRQLVEASG